MPNVLVSVSKSVIYSYRCDTNHIISTNILNVLSFLSCTYASSLRVLHNANLRRPQHPSIQLEALLLGMEAASIFLIRLGRLEDRLMHIRVEFLSRLAGVESLESMLLQRVDQDAVCHLDSIMQCDEVAVIGLELFGSDGAEGAIQIVDRLDEVSREALDSKIFCGLGFALCAFLEVAEVGDGAEVFVLSIILLASIT